jgi:hypothetical protein
MEEKIGISFSKFIDFDYSSAIKPLVFSLPIWWIFITGLFFSMLLA